MRRHAAAIALVLLLCCCCHGASNTGTTVTQASRGVTATTTTASPAASSATHGVFGEQGSFSFGGEPVARFTSSSVAWRVANQRVYRSTDAGESWQPVLTTNSDITKTNGESWFFDDSRAAVVGGDFQHGFLLYATEDGGRSWRDAFLPHTTPTVTSIDRVFFASPAVGWVLANENGPSLTLQAQILYKTSDSGKHWSTVATSSAADPLPGRLPPATAIDQMAFADQTTGWIIGNDIVGCLPTGLAVFVTIDGGITWKRQDLPPVSGFDLARAQAMSAPVQLASSGELLLPVEIPQPLPPGSPPRSSDDRVVMYKSVDGGQTWASPLVLPQTPPTDAALAGGIVDASHWWLAVYREVWVTSDAGRTWVHLAPKLPEGSRFGGACFADPRHALAVLVSGPATAALERFSYVRTVDGGATWEPAPEVPGA